jgi:hypothetical protein
MQLTFFFQVAEFQRWGINAISINEDTPNETELWNVSAA